MQANDPSQPSGAFLMTLSRLRLDEVLRDLEQAEQESGLFENGTSAVRCVYGERSATTHTFEACGRGRAWLRFLQWKRYARVVLRRYPLDSVWTFQPALARTTSRFERMRARCNVVAFYPSRGVVCKIYYESGTAAELETKAMREAYRADLFRVPKLLLEPDDPAEGNRRIRWYEYIEPHTSSLNDEETAARVMQALFAWYERHGIDLVPPRKLVERRATEFESVQGLYFSEEERTLVQQALRTAMTSTRVILESWIHNDPVLSNIMFDADGRLVLYDWEWSTRNAIILDVAKVAGYGGAGILDAYEQWMQRKLGEETHLVPANVQLALGALNGITRLKQLHEQRAHQQLPHVEADRAIAVSKNQILTVAAEIREAL